MAGEDDVELRDLVAHTLETRGVLGNIRAQLRASVFLALEEQESQQKPHPLVSSRFQEYLKTKNGQVATALVREFLTFFDLDYTCSVFDPETNALEACPVRNELARDLGLNTASSTGPLLDCLLQQRGAAAITSSQQPPLSTSSLFTAAPRQTSDMAASTTLPSQTQPVASASPSTAPNASTANTTSANDPSQLFANSSLDKPGTGGASDFSPFDQFSKPSPLPPLSRNSLDSGSNSLPVQERKDMPGASFGHTSGSVGARTSSDSQGKSGGGGSSGVPSSEKVPDGRKDDVNGKSGATGMGELNDFFSTQLNATEQREGKDDRQGSHLDGFHSDDSLSEHLDSKSTGKSGNKFEETEDLTLSQHSLTADFDYVEQART